MNGYHIEYKTNKIAYTCVDMFIHKLRFPPEQIMSSISQYSVCEVCWVLLWHKACVKQYALNIDC